MAWINLFYIKEDYSMSTEKNLEQKLRRALTKEGYQLCKSRARNWSINNQQGYMIVNPYYNVVVAGSQYDLSLQDVLAFVNE